MGIDVATLVQASVRAGRVRAVCGWVPAKGTRTFVDGATFWQEFQAYLRQRGDRALEISNGMSKASLRGLLRATLGRPTSLRVADLFLRRPESFVRLARRTPFWPSQDQEEIVSLLELLRERAPRSVLEIGTATGGTLYLFARVAAADATLVTVDIDQKCNPQLLRSFARKAQRLHSILGDSTAGGTVAAVHALLPQGVDFLFLDGDHSYEGVRSDFDQYRPLVRPGGMIALHDIVEDNTTRHGVATGGYSGGVPRFWREVRDRFVHREFVKDPRQDGLGIGVVFTPS